MFVKFKQWLLTKLLPISTEEKPTPWPILSPEEYYVLGLLTEESGEISQEVGKALRFGPNTKNPKDGTTPMERLSMECGDMRAAIDFALDHGIIEYNGFSNQYTKKYIKLTDPTNSKDNLGRPLAPQPRSTML